MKEKESRGDYQKLTDKIKKKEIELEKLESSNRLIHSTIETIRHELNSGYKELNKIHDDARRNGKVDSSLMFQHDEKQVRKFHRYMEISEEEANHEFRKKKQLLENDRDVLYRKRGDIKWD